MQQQQQQQHEAVTAAAEGSITSHALQYCTLHLLDPLRHATELSAVVTHWRATNGVGSILTVHRIENPSLLRRYEEARRVPFWSKQHQTDVTAYHGTRAIDPVLIYDSPTGFDISKGA